MKHSLKVTIALILLFVAAQVFGLFTVSQYIQVSSVNGTTTIVHQNTTMGEVPQLEEKQKTYTFLPIIIMIIVASIIFLLLIKLQFGKFWKYGFCLAVFVALSIVFGVFVNKYIAIAAAIVLAIWKVFKPNFYIHNLTEVMMYAGITIIFIPLLNIYSAIGLLIAVSIYDAYAVWKSKHMVTMAKFQSQNKAFAGIVIPYGNKPEAVGQEKEVRVEKEAKVQKEVKVHKEAKEEKAIAKHAAAKKSVKAKAQVEQAAYENIEAKGEGPRSAILGGGDIGFTLIFCSVVMEFLIITMGVAKSAAFFYALIPAACATIALTFLFIFSEKGKFYPAMPPITAGCLIGFGIVMLIV